MGNNCASTSLTRQEQNQAISCKFLKKCIDILSNFKEIEYNANFETIIEYIKRTDVQKQFANIINFFPRNNLMIMNINEHSETIEMQVILQNSKGVHYTVHFLPSENANLLVEKNKI
jgi:hypothetical protein